jgi:molybdenum cofactor biosynthesis enzyme MoaA
LKCRICCPSNSSQWASEIGYNIPIIKHDILEYKEFILNDSVQSIYYTGGEPFINVEHWEILEKLVELGYSKNINLLYNSNLTTLKFKDKDIVSLWRNFKSVNIQASVDAIEDKFNFLRSGADWNIVKENIKKLKQETTVDLSIAVTVSILNIWFIEELLEYFDGYAVTLTELHYPDYLSLAAIPNSLKPQALKCIDNIEKLYKDQNKMSYFRSQVNNNTNQQFFKDTLLHTLLLDNLRGENLFDKLPFRQEAIALAFKNL